MFYPLPKANIWDREEYVVSACVDRKVLHVGACQADDSCDFAVMNQAIRCGTWLHGRITKVAKECIGVDYNEAAITYLKNVHGIQNIIWANVENTATLVTNIRPDLIVMGEVLEHLLNPAQAIFAAKLVMSQETELLVTTPNGLSLWNFLSVVVGKEAQDPDHVVVFTPRTLTALLRKAGLEITKLGYYHEQKNTWFRNYYPKKRYSLKGWLAFLALNIGLRIAAGFSMGLIAVAKLPCKSDATRAAL